MAPAQVRQIFDGAGGSRNDPYVVARIVRGHQKRLYPGNVDLNIGMRTRSDCALDLRAILPLIGALGSEAVVRSLGRSIGSLGVWWP